MMTPEVQRGSPAANAEKAVVRVSDVSKTVGSRPVLSGIDLAVGQGRSAALLGPVRSGKTTLLRILAGIMNATSGSASVRGQLESLEAVGLYATLSEKQTGLQNLIRAGRRSGLSAEAAQQRAAGLLVEFELRQLADHEAFTYPTGAYRRLEIAAALVTAPEVLLLDQPTKGADVHSRSLIWTVLRTLGSRGTTVLVATEDPHEAVHVCDEVFVINEGRIETSGPPDWLAAHLVDGTFRLRVADAADRDPAALVIARALGASPSRENDGVTIRVPVTDKLRISRALIGLEQANLTIDAFDFTPLSLNDLIIFLGH